MNSRAQNSKQDLALKGTETVPGIAFLSDVNTGIFSPAADNFAISTGGVTAVLINGTQTMSLANALPVNSGGTGLGSYAIGDILYASASGVLSKLPVGTNGYVLTVNSGVPAWTAAAASGVASVSFGSTGLTPATASTGAVTVSGTLLPASGGTGASTYAKGDILYASATNVVSKLTVGSTGQVLTVSGGAPVWAAAAAAGVSSISFGSTGLTPSTASTGAVSVAGTLAIANGGTGATTAANARTALGLGTMATQAASAVAITGGTITTTGGITCGSLAIGSTGPSLGLVGGVGNVNFSALTSITGTNSLMESYCGGVQGWNLTSTTFGLSTAMTSATCFFGTTWTQLSDVRIKKDIAPYALGTSAINQLRPVNYVYNGEYGSPDNGIVQTGLIAQEVLTTPLASMVGTRVYTNPDTGVETTLYDLNTNQLVFALINSVKELSARIGVLEAKAP